MEYVIRTAGETDRDEPAPANQQQVIAYHTDVSSGTAGDGFAMNKNMNQQGGNISFNMNGGSTATTTTTTTTSSNIDYDSGNRGGCGYASRPAIFPKRRKPLKMPTLKTRS